MGRIFAVLLPVHVDNTIRGTRLPFYIFALYTVISTVRSLIHLLAPDGVPAPLRGWAGALRGRRHDGPTASGLIQRSNRRQRYRALARADPEGIDPLVYLVGRAAERSLALYLEACTPQTVPPSADDEWIPLRAAVQGTLYSQEYQR